jgi:putative PEP-CTERM system histidine kinase
LSFFWNLSFAGAALAYGLLSAMLLVRGSRNPLNGSFAAAAAATSLWAAVELAHPAPWNEALFTALRDGAWLLLLILLIRSRSASQNLWRYLAGAAGLLVTAELVFGLGQFDLSAGGALRLNQAVMRMAVSAFGLILLENLLRNCGRQLLWALKLMSIGLGLIFAFNLFLEIPPLFLGANDGNPVLAQPLLYLAALPLLTVTAVRIPAVGLKVHSSRRVVFHTAMLISTGVIVEAMALAALYVRSYGGTIGTVLALVLIFSGLAGILTAAASASLRSRLKLFISENFFSYKYDYRQEWTNFIRALSNRDEESVSQRVLSTLADQMDCPGGVLLVWRESWNRFMPGAQAGVSADPVPLNRGDDLLTPFQDPDLPFLELPPGESQAAAGWRRDYPFAWLVVPLRYRDGLAGVAVLGKPRAPHRLDWEDRQLIALLASQLAVYLAHDDIARALADARHLEEFNRRVAFVVHDMKNSVGQLSLLAQNVARFGDNPKFREDMVVTIRHAVGQLQELLARLKGEQKGPRQSLAPVDLAGLIAAFVAAKKRLGLPVSLRGGPTGPAVTAIDQAALLSVLEHVISNALEAAPGAEVMIGLDKVGESWRISVQDKGMGMAPTFLSDELFRPLRSTKGEGFGIGAYQARQTMRDLDGELEILSKLGDGTTVHLTLPERDKTA